MPRDALQATTCPRPGWLGYAVAPLGIALMTALIQVTPGASHIANISMLYLLVVIGTAVAFGSGPAVLASILAFLAFNWFFVAPQDTLAVRDPAEWIALVTFLVTAAVTGQLTAMLRDRAAEARRRERETGALAEASWAVAAQVDAAHALAEVLRRLGDVVPLASAAIVLPGAAGDLQIAARIGDAPAELGEADGRAVCLTLESGTPVGWEEPQHAEAAYLPLVMDERVLGVLCLRPSREIPPSPGELRIIQSLASQAAVVLERDRLAQAEAAARALREADRLKTALLSMVSHDFRSPLTSIKASVTALMQEGTARDAGTQQELLRGIDQETDRLNGMVANILALSRLEADAWRPRREPTPLSEVVGAALDTFTAEENRRIQVSLAPAPGEVSLDPVQMVQVLRNLLDNALKYSPPAAPVELRAGREAETLVLEVLDRGIGLPPGPSEQIFQPFFRAPHLQESSIPGVGIGLAVCRGLVEAHGGTLSAHPRPGGGSVFRITLPLGGNER